MVSVDYIVISDIFHVHIFVSEKIEGFLYVFQCMNSHSTFRVRDPLEIIILFSLKIIRPTGFRVALKPAAILSRGKKSGALVQTSNNMLVRDFKNLFQEIIGYSYIIWSQITPNSQITEIRQKLLYFINYIKSAKPKKLMNNVFSSIFLARKFFFHAGGKKIYSPSYVSPAVDTFLGLRNAILLLGAACPKKNILYK